MEIEFIRALRKRLPVSPQLAVGPGDDAAILHPDGSVVTCDLLCDGTHFSLSSDSPHRIGRKALAVNLSDLAAMAAEPVAAFLAVALPREHPGIAEPLLEGMLPLAEEFDVAIAGGDTNVWDGPLVVSITLVGRCPYQPLLRSGAQPGDQLLVTGTFGGSRLGKQFDFCPRIHEALHLQREQPIHAGIDCSDGLSLDASRLAEESGVGVAIDLDAVPVSEAAREMASRDAKLSALERALGDGEDFELLLAVPPERAAVLLATQPLATPLTQIGTFTEKTGLWRDAKNWTPLSATGYEHRSDDE
ncbi:MAG: thiamine-phosphate kinase [Planctomycetota bacterium]|nr:thiamine-phosphate kinase [Planctomycetota bacterium]